MASMHRPDIQRRKLLGSGLAIAAGFAFLPHHSIGFELPDSPRLSPERLVDDIERRTFQFFWETTNPQNGLVWDRWPSQEYASVASVGFGLTAYPIGVERGFVSRRAAAERVLATARFFRNAPQGPQVAEVTGHKGFFYHFLDMRTGYRIPNVELSTVDTALLMGGMLFCRTYFDRSNSVETEIRSLIDEIEARIDWAWAQPRAPAICHGWHPIRGFIENDWLGYNEAMLVYIMALGSPKFAVRPEAWAKWCSTYHESWGSWHGHEHLTFPPLFGHQYSHVWVDFRGLRDRFMRAKDLDYFENSRRAAYAQRAYASANPNGWKGYGSNVWGLTGSDGPGEVRVDQDGKTLSFQAYTARGTGILYTFDDGTIAPTAAASSIAFAPEIALPALHQMIESYGSTIYGEYGFFDAFNLSFDYNKALSFGRRVPGFGWVDVDYLGIDQGPILAMIANRRSELIWSTMRRHPTIRRGLERAGFTGGWLDDKSQRA